MSLTSDFLPTNYEPPKTTSGLFLKLIAGENRIRILAKPVMGFQYWNEANKCVRSSERPSTTPQDIRKKEGVPDKIKHFWAMPVWSYASEQVCILEITQSTIQNALVALNRSEDWGSPLRYDLKIVKSGEKLDTEYNVIPIPPKPLSKEIEAAYKESKINLDSLFESSGIVRNLAAEIERVQRMTGHTFAQIQFIAKSVLGYSINSFSDIQSEEDCVVLLAAMQSNLETTDEF